jgi:hypothetical protein
MKCSPAVQSVVAHVQQQNSGGANNNAAIVAGSWGSVSYKRTAIVNMITVS